MTTTDLLQQFEYDLTGEALTIKKGSKNFLKHYTYPTLEYALKKLKIDALPNEHYKMLKIETEQNLELAGETVFYEIVEEEVWDQTTRKMVKVLLRKWPFPLPHSLLIYTGKSFVFDPENQSPEYNLVLEFQTASQAVTKYFYELRCFLFFVGGEQYLVALEALYRPQIPRKPAPVRPKKKRYF